MNNCIRVDKRLCYLYIRVHVRYGPVFEAICMCHKENAAKNMGDPAFETRYTHRKQDAREKWRTLQRVLSISKNQNCQNVFKVHTASAQSGYNLLRLPHTKGVLTRKHMETSHFYRCTAPNDRFWQSQLTLKSHQEQVKIV